MKQPYKKAIVNVLFTLFVIGILLFLVPKVWIYFLPFLLAWLIAACAAPIVRFLEKRINLKWKMGSAIVIVAVIAGIVFLFYFAISTLVGQLAGWLSGLPDLISNLSSVIDEIETQLAAFGIIGSGGLQDISEQFESQILSAVSAVADGSSKFAISFVGNMTKQIPLFLIGLIVCLLSAYFFVADKKENEMLLQKVIPEGIQKNWKVFSMSIKHALGGYMKAQFKIEFWIYLVLVIGLFVLRVDYVLLIAFIIAFLDLLPLFGAGIIMVPWAVVSFVCGDYTLAVGLLIVWGLTQVLRQLIQPKYVGESMGIKPLPTLILLYLGYCIDGMAGLILAIPIGYVTMNLYKAGIFDNTVKSIKLLVNGFWQYRKFDEGEKKEPK